MFGYGSKYASSAAVELESNDLKNRMMKNMPLPMLISLVVNIFLPYHIGKIKLAIARKLDNESNKNKNDNTLHASPSLLTNITAMINLKMTM